MLNSLLTDISLSKCLSSLSSTTTSFLSSHISGVLYSVYFVTGMSICNLFGLLRGREGRKSSNASLVQILLYRTKLYLSNTW